MTQPYQHVYPDARQKLRRRQTNRPYEQTYGEYPRNYPNVPLRASSSQKRAMQRSSDMLSTTEQFDDDPHTDEVELEEVVATKRIPIQTQEIKRFNRNSFIAQMVVGGCIAAALIVALITVVDWGTNKYNDIIYGNPRSSHLFAIVGHNDVEHPSFFIANNLNSQISIVECPASDCSKAAMILGPELNSTQEVVTLTFKDLGNGHPDMLIHAQNQVFVIMNTGKKFDPAIKPTQEEMNNVK